MYYDTLITFKEFRDEAERLAGFLERACGVKKGGHHRLGVETDGGL
ncbi:MAG TPA: hypothetical protein VGA88_08000 [Burkholderiales bacterium]